MGFVVAGQEDLAVAVDDGGEPEPGHQQHFGQVGGVPKVDVDRRQEDRQRPGEHQHGHQGQREDGHEGEIRLDPEGEEGDDEHYHLDGEEDQVDPDHRQGQELAWKGHLLDDARLSHHHPGGAHGGAVEQVPRNQAGEEPDGEVRLVVAGDDLEDHVVDGQHHGRVEHRPGVAQHRVLVLDLELGADQQHEQVAVEPQVLQALPELDLPVDDGDPVVTLTRNEAGTPPDDGSAIWPTRGGLVDTQAHLPVAPASAVGTLMASFWMTSSMNPYSRASSAVNQRSRSESASIRSTGCPVWKAIRSAIILLR